MKGKEQRLPDYLGHMVEAIDRIETYVGAMNKAGFVANTLVIDAVIRNIEVIGEASNKVRKHHRAFADAHPEVPCCRRATSCGAKFTRDWGMKGGGGAPAWIECGRRRIQR
ncbi:HepT-like ribonuclease domain-containing protein [Burkholderia ubonensis]|uniref:HepT-like ribonuclease domain-containing protein n=1 Tax=Burkholderia ubonensis TaxID=101571 RepID=UPI002AB2B504|nr:HepT-like ribonuclease domain-containing protein [Burkholderia ubonensis]